ncbi:MAG TPA: class I SAM-dependent methyltransferase [Leptolinea sp.]
MKISLHQLLFNIQYLGNPPWDTNQSPPELLEFIQNHPAGRALDIGCGTGMNCFTLAKAGWQTTGVDFAWRAIRLAEERFRKNDLMGKFIKADITCLNELFTEFDLVLDIGCYHSLPATSRQAYRSLVPTLLLQGGDFLLYGHQLSVKKDNRVRLAELDIHQFQETLFLIKRKDCEDRWGRKTVWLWFKKPVK